MNYLHLVFLAALSSISTTVCAQIKMENNGHVMVGDTAGVAQSYLSVGDIGNSGYVTSLSNETPLGISTNRDAVLVFQRGMNSCASTIKTALTVQSEQHRYGSNTGIYILPYSNENAYDGNYGVKSLTGYSMSDNVGVYGGVIAAGSTGTRNVAGVFGSSTSSMSFLTNGVYAGYFRGTLRVDNGQIIGSLVTPSSVSGGSSATMLPSAPDSRGEESVSAKLSKVGAMRISVERDKNVRTPDEMAGNEKFRSKDGVDEPSELSADEQRAATEAIMAGEKNLTIVNEKPASVHYGLAVDQLKEVYPELVYEDSYGNVSVNYVEMIPLLVQALNEQSAKIDALCDRLAEYTGEDAMTAEAKDRTEATAVDTAISDAAMVKTLGQNDPNPFSESTSISMTIPSSVKSAFLYIYDMSGKQVAGVTVTTRGKTAVSVTGHNLTPGMYLYSLVCDGEVVATRRMILTR